MIRSLLVAAILAASASIATADEIILTNGRTIVGIHRTDKRIPGKVVVEVGTGTIIFDAKEVSAVNPGRTPLHEFDERWADVKGSQDVNELWALVAWCQENKVTRHVRTVCEEIIEKDPDHRGARKALRHEQVNGRWMPYEEAMAAKGFVKYGAKWITAAERELIEQRRLAAQDAYQKRREERKRKQEEARAKKLAAMKEYHEWLARESRLPYGYMYRPSWFLPAYYRPYPWTPYKHKRPPGGYEGYYGGGAIPTFDLFRFIPNAFGK